MNFLSPAFLWALPAALAPLILHLMSRRHPQKMPFSHIPWLREIHQKMMPKKKLRELLLLIVRTLLVLALVFFFARPLLRQGSLLTGPGERGALVVLVDVSASMGAVADGREILTGAVQQVQELLRQWPADRPVGLIVFSDQVEKELSPSTDRALILSTLGSLKPGTRSTDSMPALKLGYQMLANQPKGANSLLVMSDQARNAWSAALEGEGRFPEYSPDVRVILWEVAERQPNTGISQATLQLGEEGTLSGRADIRRFGGGAKSDSWQLELNGRKVGQGTLEDEVAFQAQLPDGGSYSGRLSISPDVMPFDDVYYVAGRIPKGYRVLVVDGEAGFAPSDSESYYMRSALESPRDPRLESLKLIRLDALGPETLDLYDVIVLANVGKSEREEELSAWVQKGGGLFLTAGSLWPAAPNGPLRLFRTKAPRAGAAVIQRPDALPSMLSGLGGVETFEWSKAGINKYIPLEMESSLEPLLMLDSGDPLLVLKRMGAGTVVTLTTSLDRSWTNLPAKPLFAPVIRELVASLADPAREKAALNFIVGEPVKIPVAPQVTRAVIHAPDGSSTGGAVRQGYLEWSGLSQPGLYRVETNVKTLDFVFAANMDGREKESDPARLTLTEAKKIFPEAYVEWISKQNQPARGLLAALEGKDVTNILLGLVFLFFLLESVLGWRRSARLKTAALLLALSLTPWNAHAGNGNQFVFTQLEYNGAWDPYPGVNDRIFQMLKGMTNIPMLPGRKVVKLSDPALFESTFLLVKGNGTLPFSREEKARLKQFIDRGGFVFFDDTLADSKGPFAESVRALCLEIFPDRRFQRLPIDHALFRSFFLLRNVAGRRISERYLEGLDVGGEKEGEGRTAVIYCPNDLMGAWMKDNLGQYTYSCEPGGETQRWEAFKLTVNIIYFSLTGTYKKDAIHQPFIEMKLGS